MYSRKNCRTKNGALRNYRINWIFLWRLLIQNHPKPSITEKRRNRVKYLTWNSIRLKFVKKTSMPNAAKIEGYIKFYSLSSPINVKTLSNAVRKNCLKICSWLRRPKTILKITKKATFLLVINNPIICKFFRDFTDHRKKTNRVVVLSCRPFTSILVIRIGGSWFELH